MKLKTIFEIIQDENGYHSKYEVIFYEREKKGYCEGDFILL